jgi:IS1 family transposase/transposase-like protein
MLCSVCERPCVKYGKNRNGTQRYLCRKCFLTFSEARAQEPRVFSDRSLTMNKATTAIRLLMEGNSIRSTCRILHLGQSTVLDLLLRVGRGCARLHHDYVIGVSCRTVQCDELWSFVWCKEKTRVRKGYGEDELGDCYTWTAIDPATKLMVAYAVGKRDHHTAMKFVRKLSRATVGRYQINTDGLGIYRMVIPPVFGNDFDHAQVIKVFGAPIEAETRYSPPQIVDMRVEVGGGNPNLDIACTSHVERSNLTIRMMLRRFTRLTNAHSKQWRYHEAAIALLFAYYNFCRKHMSLERGCTPAMEAGLANHAWSVKELIERALPQDIAADAL